MTIINSVRNQQSTSSRASKESLDAFENDSAKSFNVMTNNDRDYFKEEFMTNVEIQFIDESTTSVHKDRRM